MLVALFVFALLNVAYTVWSRFDNDDEAMTSMPPAGQRATHVREAAAASPATPQVSPTAKTEPTNVATTAPQRPRPKVRMMDKTDRVAPPQRDLSSVLQEKEDFLKNYRSGSQTDLGGANYDLLNLRAIPKSDYVPDMGPAVTEKMNYVFVAGSQGLTADTTLPVVAKSSNGRLGIVTGTFIVKIKRLSDLSPVARAHGLTVKYVDEDILTAYLTSAPATSLNDLLLALRSDPSVENASLEVISSFKRF